MKFLPYSEPRPYRGNCQHAGSLHVDREGLWIDRSPRGNERSMAWYPDHPAIRQLVAAVDAEKLRVNRCPGGSFWLSDSGDVVVPAAEAGGGRTTIGVFRGHMLFEAPDGSPFSLDIERPDLFDPGEPAGLPLFGTVYRLSEGDRLYHRRPRRHGDRYGAVNLRYAAPLDREEVELIRDVVGAGPAALLVTHERIVLAPFQHEALFVTWFSPEEWAELWA